MISIIIPVYNTELYLNRCLDSCFAQIYQDIEVIAVNDGSTDDSENILNKYAENESRLKVISQTNSGVAVARNHGVENATGDWIMFVDSDDWLTCDALVKMYNRITDECDIVVATYRIAFHENKYGNTYSLSENEYLGSNYIDLLLKGQIVWGPVAKLFSRKLFLNNHYTLDGTFKRGEDLILNLQLASLSRRVIVINEVIYNYFQRDNSAINTIKSSLEYEKKFIKKTLEPIDLNVHKEAVSYFLYIIGINMIKYGIYYGRDPIYNDIYTASINSSISTNKKLIMYAARNRIFVSVFSHCYYLIKRLLNKLTH